MKSRLETEEMRRLKEQGMSQKEIGRLAGIHEVAVGCRLNPEPKRSKERDRYRNADPETQRRYIDSVRRRQIELQDQTELLAEKVGDLWTEEELDYLREHGETKTIFELAIDLDRTYNAVRKAVQRYKIPLRKE